MLPGADLGDGGAAAGAQHRDPPARAGPELQPLRQPRREVGRRCVGGLELDAAGRVAHQPHAVLDLDEEADVAAGADQRHHVLEARVAGERPRRGGGRGRGLAAPAAPAAAAAERGRSAGGASVAAGGRGPAPAAAALAQPADQLLRARQVGDMGQPDHRHLRRHHRVRRGRHLLQRLQQHLPDPGQHPHLQPAGEVEAAGALVGADGGVVGRLGGELHHRHPVGDLGEIAQHRQRVGAGGVLRRELGQRAAGVAAP